MAARSGVPWSDEASGERGSRGEKDPALSEQQLALRVPNSPSSLALYWPHRRKCVCVRAQSMSGGGNTVLLMLTLARTFCSTHRRLIVLQDKTPGRTYFVISREPSHSLVTNTWLIKSSCWDF